MTDHPIIHQLILEYTALIEWLAHALSFAFCCGIA